MRFNIFYVAIISKACMAVAIPDTHESDLETRQCTFVKCADGVWRVIQSAVGSAKAFTGERVRV
ncbi:unnamed protein product [Clonostachys rosea f. rosea IK726]|uniref:Uncharacterized protein n=1 Tax=Clonostachys rosea f. rosea IK726 TaxID=1349383 RepID=A0ACA9U5C0_BIOOC|nr:unnamed protein product [Clonostachys rosea f. rosea IK726]